MSHAYEIIERAVAGRRPAAEADADVDILASPPSKAPRRTCVLGCPEWELASSTEQLHALASASVMPGSAV